MKPDSSNLCAIGRPMYPTPTNPSLLFSHVIAFMTSGSLGNPSRDRHQRSARDTELSNAGLPRCRVEGPSTSDTECPGRTPRPEAGHLRPRGEDPRHGCYLPVA